MNRGEQELLFRQAHTIRLQQDAKAHNERIRHYSHGNIHQVSNLQSQAANSRSFGEDRPFGTSHCDDLVLSVLKTPLKESSLATPTPSPQSCVYSALPGSEDELVDDAETTKEVFDFEGDDVASGSGFHFFRRFRAGRPPPFESHHRRVPTPMRRKSRHRSKSHADILVTGDSGTFFIYVVYHFMNFQQIKLSHTVIWVPWLAFIIHSYCATAVLCRVG